MKETWEKIQKRAAIENSIAALNKQQVSPPRSVAPHYRYFIYNDSVTLIQSNPSKTNIDKFALLRQSFLSAVVLVVILIQLTLKARASTPPE